MPHWHKRVFVCSFATCSSIARAVDLFSPSTSLSVSESRLLIAPIPGPDSDEGVPGVPGVVEETTPNGEVA